MKIKITDLKKQLKEYNQKQLIDLIVEMFKANKEIQNYISSKFLGEEVNEILFLEARKKIENEFFPDKGDGKLRLADAKKEIIKFKKTTNDEKRTVDLKLYFVEQGVEYTNAFGDIDSGFYSSIATMFNQVADECNKNEELYREFAARLDKVVSKAQGVGWGFAEVMVDIYYSIGWVFEEDEE